MTKTSSLPGWEDQDTGEVVVVPRHLLFAEEAGYLSVGVIGSLQDEGVVEEGRGVEEDGFGLEEEFGEEGEVLAVQL